MISVVKWYPDPNSNLNKFVHQHIANQSIQYSVQYYEYDNQMHLINQYIFLIIL